MRRVPSSHGKAPAFTLVELLVVIGVIGVLVGILMPALAAARRSAQSVKCLNNLRQIATGAMIHAQRHKGFYPLAGNLQTPGARPADLRDPERVRYTYYEPPNGAYFLASFHGAIGSVFGNQRGLDEFTFNAQVAAENDPEGFLRMFYCPSDLSRPEEMTYAWVYYAGGFGWYLRQSYVVNEAFVGWDDARDRRRGNINQIKRPAEVMLAMDGRTGGPSRRVGNMSFATVANKTPNGPVTLADALLGNARAGDPQNFDHQRHRKRVNISFLDGHAETLAIEAGKLRAVLILPE
jgi:prepilin-type processing-associated H-X9-DG protein/prepilin-type N-terminal cleavage/methylation domain-containing protein